MILFWENIKHAEYIHTYVIHMYVIGFYEAASRLTLTAMTSFAAFSNLLYEKEFAGFRAKAGNMNIAVT
jgi:hypothetical protein